MAEYIEREAAKQFVKKYAPHIDGETTMECVERAIENVPAADVVEVRHGYWAVHFDGGNGDFVCSVCHRNKRSKVKEPPYCQSCGAKMDGKDGKE